MSKEKVTPFDEAARLINKFCKAKRSRGLNCGACPMRIIPDGCWFKKNPSGWRLESFLESAGELLEMAEGLDAQDKPEESRQG